VPPAANSTGTVAPWKSTIAGEQHNADPFDGPYRGRTCDLGIKSPLLYQLS
jgi:hypothetical protein